METPKIQVRRKPAQSRAKMTQEALLDSFVRLLHEYSADKITIREITNLAGVGLGTFYEYFSKKEDLIALTIHLHIKNNAEQLQTYAQSLNQLSTNLEFQDYLAYVIHFQLGYIQNQQFLWAQIFLLERQISNIESYRKSYAMMVEMWRNILSLYLQDQQQLEQFSLNIHRICYGFISQTLLVEPNFKKWDELERDLLETSNQFIKK